MNDDDNVGRDPHVEVDELDCEFLYTEIIKNVCNMNRHRSADIDGNVVDFFIDAIEFNTSYLVTMFNYIFDKGIYPKSWCNYRGITLINVVAKIFSTLLRNRINKWCEDETIFNQAQFGFRDKRSTVDCIFI